HSPPPPPTLFPYTTLFRSPPELPGLAAASNWIRLVRRSPSGARKLRLSPDITPPEAEGPMPNGKPTASTWSPGSRSLVPRMVARSEEHTSELQSLRHLVCR